MLILSLLPLEAATLGKDYASLDAVQRCSTFTKGLGKSQKAEGLDC